MSERLWFNKTFSSLHAFLQVMKTWPGAADWRVVVSHTQADFLGFHAADEAHLEPPGLAASDYLAWCLEFCQKHRITLFHAGKAADSLAESSGEFSRIGTKLLTTADGPTLRLLERKADYFSQIPLGMVDLPLWERASTAAQFSNAVAKIRHSGAEACFKPSTGVNGLGFYRLVDELRPLHRLLDAVPYRISLAEAETILAQQDSFRELLIMEYLPGVECSVDCLGYAGALRAAIVRRKAEGHTQTLTHDPELIAASEALCAQFRLRGLFNVQFRQDRHGRPRLLEINARFSGGLPYSCLSGINFPALAIAQAIAERDHLSVPEIPLPKLPLKVLQTAHFHVAPGGA